MPNRYRAGYMGHRKYDRTRNAEDARMDSQAVPMQRELTQEPGPAGRGDLLDEGDFSRNYEEWSKGDLYHRARKLGIRGRSGMTRDDLIRAIRVREEMYEQDRGARGGRG